MYHTVTTIPTSNQKILKTGSIDTRNTRMRDRSLYYLGADTYMKRQDYASFVGRDADLAVSVLSFFKFIMLNAFVIIPEHLYSPSVLVGLVLLDCWSSV